MARCRHWEKIPILEARAIGYRTGPKIGDFFPIAVKRNSLPRKMGPANLPDFGAPKPKRAKSERD